MSTIGYIIDKLPTGMIEYLYREWGAYIYKGDFHIYMTLDSGVLLEDVPYFFFDHPEYIYNMK